MIAINPLLPSANMKIAQYAHGVLIERELAGLGTPHIPILDRAQPSIEVDEAPAQLEKLTAPQTGVHR